MVEEKILTDGNSGSSSILTRCDPQRDMLVPNSNTCSHEPVLKTQGKNIGSSMQSNSVSSTLGSSCSRLKRERRNRGDRDTNNVIQSRAGRSSKRKPNAEVVALHSQQVPQLYLNPAAAECNTITSPKKPRKRGSRRNPEGMEMDDFKHVSSVNMADHPDNCGKMDGQKMLNPTLPLEPLPPSMKDQTNTGQSNI